MNSESKEELLDKLYEIVKDDLRDEIYKEALQIKSKREERNIKAYELYNRFHYDNPIVLKYLKKSLPLRVRLLNKININGMSIENNIIRYSYYFNNDIGFKFIYEPSVYDMEKWR